MTESNLVDLQVNGFAGVDFNSDGLADEQIERACQQLRSHGTVAALATVITDRLERMERRIRRLAEAMNALPGIAETLRGIHVEGPFISPVPGYVGAHPAEHVLPPSVDAAKRLLAAGRGHVRIVTLAPEHDPRGEVVAYLAQQGVTVSAGHCDPSSDDLERAIDCGLAMFTHLGNGCPLQLDRHQNVIQRVLSKSQQLWVCFIADGVHVPFYALRNYLRIVGPERAIVVSDAISAAGLGPGVYTLGDQSVVVDDNLATWAADRSHLVGSAMTLQQALVNLTESVGLSREEALRLTRDNPRRAIGPLGS